MRNLHLLDVYRMTGPEIIEFYGSIGDSETGVFLVPSPIDGQRMMVIASNDFAWDHVSVSLRSRCPTWEEMEHVKRLFFRDDETAMQLHVPPAEHRSLHPYCLHLWRPCNQEIPKPPPDLVAPDQVST